MAVRGGDQRRRRLQDREPIGSIGLHASKLGFGRPSAEAGDPRAAEDQVVDRRELFQCRLRESIESVRDSSKGMARRAEWPKSWTGENFFSADCTTRTKACATRRKGSLVEPSDQSCGQARTFSVQTARLERNRA